MKKTIILFTIILISVAVFIIPFYWMHTKKEPAYGTMIILSITFVSILFYTYFNFQLLYESYRPYGNLRLESADHYLRVIVSNLCKIPLKVTVNLNPSIEGKPIKLSPGYSLYSGKKEWIIPPFKTEEGKISAYSFFEVLDNKDVENTDDFEKPKYPTKGTKKIIKAIIEESEKEKFYFPSSIFKSNLKLEVIAIFNDFKGRTYKENVKYIMFYDHNINIWIKGGAEKI